MRRLLILLGLLAGLIWMTQAMAQPQVAGGQPQVAARQKPLTDIDSIETLRAQFNRDAGLIRLVVFLVPT